MYSPRATAKNVFVEIKDTDEVFLMDEEVEYKHSIIDKIHDDLIERYQIEFPKKKMTIDDKYNPLNIILGFL